MREIIFFPDVKEFILSSYNVITDEEILEKINMSYEMKRNWANFRGAYIKKSSAEMLKKKGFNVKTYRNGFNVPCFEITWPKEI